MYHAGFFNIPSGDANICEWEVTTFSGEIIYQDTTSGSSFEQGLVLFNHSVPITDSLKATIVITNSIEEIICTLKDTLYWKEIAVASSFIGNWDVLNSNPGIEEELTSSNEIALDKKVINLFPSPTQDYFQITGIYENHSFSILDLSGKILGTFNNIRKHDKVFPEWYLFCSF